MQIMKVHQYSYAVTSAAGLTNSDCSYNVLGHKSMSSGQHTVPLATLTFEKFGHSLKTANTPRPSRGCISKRRALPSAKPSSKVKPGSACTVNTRAMVCISGSTKRLYGERLFALGGQLPVGHQIFAMNFNPSLYQAQLGDRQAACQQTPIHNGKTRFAVLIAHMDVRQMVALIVKKILHDDQTVEDADGRHVTIVEII